MSFSVEHKHRMWRVFYAAKCSSSLCRSESRIVRIGREVSSDRRAMKVLKNNTSSRRSISMREQKCVRASPTHFRSLRISDMPIAQGTGLCHLSVQILGKDRFSPLSARSAQGSNLSSLERDASSVAGCEIYCPPICNTAGLVGRHLQRV